MIQLLIWRHGRTEWNSIGRVQGQTDIDLDDTGVAQAAESAARLAARQPSLIISSDLLRAASTAAALGALTGLPVTYDPRLRERDFGPWEGRTPAEIHDLDADGYARWRTSDESDIAGIENLGDLGKRAASAFLDAAERVGDGTAVVVTHGGAARAGCATMLGWPTAAAQTLKVLRNCHRTELHHDERGWQLYSHNVF